ncbi:MAG: 3-phosphoshikimate 1-carboxyvinyltransferase [Candidatus Azobacteroides sp.]|nr:3-phosphoshikimate 1-carboxyvinyltransferase [Candidatus Azobacteroides sp.]
MKYKINAPDIIHTNITLPASKSISNRILIINELGYSPYEIENLSDSDDTQVLLKALQSNDNCFDIGAAGTSMRFLTAYLSKIAGEWQITGTERMKQRPIRILVEALNKLGARIEYLEKEGYPPLKIYGSSLTGGEAELNGGVSSQYISALLMIAPTMREGLTLTLSGNIISTPYIRLTLKLMEEFGVHSEWIGNKIRIAPQEYIPKRFKVEADWSAASYWYQIAALSKKSSVLLPGLLKESYQGDAKVAEIFNRLGVKTTFLQDGIQLEKTPDVVEKLEYDFTSQPDLAQTFVVTCVMMGIPFRFTGLQSLKIKETDRIEALKIELKKLGYLLQDEQDSILTWNGESTEAEASPVIHTYEDHRMAMAFAPVALKKENICIADPDVVTKSYPGYWTDLQAAGFTIQKEG